MSFKELTVSPKKKHTASPLSNFQVIQKLLLPCYNRTRTAINAKNIEIFSIHGRNL
jgi:hypothetical protein